VSGIPALNAVRQIQRDERRLVRNKSPR